MIVVTGATGNTGRVVARRLLDAREDVRVLGRSVERLQPLIDGGADAAAGEIEDVVFLTTAFRGATAVYAMIPPDYEEPDYMERYRRIASVLAQAIDLSDISHVVLLSSVGAELESGSGVVLGLHHVEERLKQIPGLNLLILRPGYFFENLFANLPLIRHQGIHGAGFGPDSPLPMIAAGDVGTAAAARLSARDFTGVSVRDLYGPRELTMTEVTRIIGERIGKPDLPYVQLSDDQLMAGLAQAGFPASIVRLYVEFSHALDAGRLRGHQSRSDANTGTTTFETFAETLAEAYRRL